MVSTLQRCLAIASAHSFINCAHGALRQTKTQVSPLSLYPPTDTPSCPTDPIYHGSNPALNELIQNRKEWYNEVFRPLLELGTFESNDLYVSLPSGNNNFIYWEQVGGVRGVDTPVMEMSAWTTNKANEIVALEGSYTADTYTWDLIHPDKKDFSVVEEVIQLKGDYVVFMCGWFSHYQHILIDYLGYLVYIGKTFPPTTKILVPESKDMSVLFSVVDGIEPELAQRLQVIECAGSRSCFNQRFEIIEGSLSVFTPKSSTRHLDLYEMVRSWIWNSPSLRSAVSQDSTPTVVYYKRCKGAGASRTINKRYMDEQQEDDIIHTIEHALKRYDRPEKLVIFDGSQSFQEQAQMFMTATTVIGPHGGGLANILLMKPTRNCQDRPRVLEFVTSSATPLIQAGALIASFYTLYSTCPWLELHELLFTSQSNRDTTYIDMKAFRDAIKTLFGGKSSFTEEKF